MLLEAQRLKVRPIEPQRLWALTGMHDGIPHAIHHEQQDHRGQPYWPQGQRPGKGDAAQIAQEERWIPQWGQTAADVTDEKIKKTTVWVT